MGDCRDKGEARQIWATAGMLYIIGATARVAQENAAIPFFSIRVA
jgi:hypothetical protein